MLGSNVFVDLFVVQGVLWCCVLGHCVVLECCEGVCSGLDVTGGEQDSVSWLVGHSLAEFFVSSVKVPTVTTPCHHLFPL